MSNGIVPALLALLLFFATPCATTTALAEANRAAPASSSPLKIDALGKGAVPLDGAWQFHTGDNVAWANPEIDDVAGQNGWEQLTTDSPWGTQSHPNYDGPGWYRRHIDLTTAPGAPADVALLIPAIDDIYQIYWNGQPVGHLGSFPPHVDYLNLRPRPGAQRGPGCACAQDSICLER
jgi:hypothetical protein